LSQKVSFENAYTNGSLASRPYSNRDDWYKAVIVYVPMQNVPESATYDAESVFLSPKTGNCCLALWAPVANIVPEEIQADQKQDIQEYDAEIVFVFNDLLVSAAKLKDGKIINTAMDGTLVDGRLEWSATGVKEPDFDYAETAKRDGNVLWEREDSTLKGREDDGQNR